jgi:hypothetical protein
MTLGQFPMFFIELPSSRDEEFISETFQKALRQTLLIDQDIPAWALTF